MGATRPRAARFHKHESQAKSSITQLTEVISTNRTTYNSSRKLRPKPVFLISRAVPVDFSRAWPCLGVQIGGREVLYDTVGRTDPEEGWWSHTTGCIGVYVDS